MRYILFLFFTFLVFTVYAQNAMIVGKVFTKSGIPIGNASITISSSLQTNSNDKGEFQISIPIPFQQTIVISHIGYETHSQKIELIEPKSYLFNFYLTEKNVLLDTAVVVASTNRTEVGGIQITANKANLNPSPVGGIEGLIKIFVGSNNELSSQYTVRGGNYDENLVYVNDFEVYRPYLVRSGQQEGLSFIHPDMVNDVKFYNGGFSAKYNDKMSSVLDVQYKQPENFGGTVYVSLLEQGVHLGDVSKNKKFTYSIGARNRTNQNLLKSQETTGNYVPSSRDIQAYLTYQINSKNQINFLGNLSTTQFSFIPAFSQLSSNVFSSLGVSNIGVNILFEGSEKDRYTTRMGGVSWKYQPRSRLQLKWLLSYLENDESEQFDIKGNYVIGERNFQQGGVIDDPLGAGMYHKYARNTLKIGVFNLSHKGSLKKDQHFFEWGWSWDHQTIKDQLYEWDYQDSAGYHIQNGNGVGLSNFTAANNQAKINRASAYFIDKWAIGKNKSFILQPGIRTQYNDLNKEWLISPRVNISYSNPEALKDIIWKMAIGLYHQPPFYREMRRYDGNLNTSLKAQKSWQVSGGFDYQFHINNLPFRWTTEIYYKNIWDQVSYEIDNVRIRYSGENDSKAYATGIETRLFGELVKGAESWISVGFMRAKEKLENDGYFDYITDDNNQIVDSISMNRGWMRRPTDRFITLGMFIQDYLAKNQNNKVYLNILYGSNLPYSIPNNIKFRNQLKIDPYIRVDIGFSTLLYSKYQQKQKSNHPFSQLETIWATIEVFNLIDRDNIIAYQFIKDYNNSNYALPNRLTPRLLNFKIIAKF